LAIGLSYFTNSHDIENNKLDMAIGSSFTWAFQGGIYQRFYLCQNPKNNIGIGAHINANFGEADFSELSITYSRRKVSL
jgi:hypothetical protein